LISFLVLKGALLLTDKFSGSPFLEVNGFTSELIFRAALKNTPVTIFVLDTQLRFTWIYNPSVGQPAEKFIGKTVGEMSKPKDASALINFYSEVLKSGVARQEEFRLDFEDKVAFYEIYALPLKNSSDEVTGLVVASTDVTHHKKYEEEIARIASFPELNPNPVIEADFDGNIEYANLATKKMFPDLKTLGSRHPFLSDWESVVKTLENEKGTFSREIKVGKHWYHQQFYVVSKSKCVRIYAEIFHERAKQLKENERLAAIGQTAGMVGHDIRNPLQAIVGELFLAKDEIVSLPDGDAKKNLQKIITYIEENLFYIDKIIADLQDYTKPLKLNKEKVNIEKVIEEALLIVPIPNNLHVSISIEEGFSQFTADFSMLKRVLMNLIQNAVQAMPNGGSLNINARSKGSHVYISVEDTGEGIPEEVKSKLFKPLFTTKSKGQGFGLAVVKRLVEAQGGKISFESQKGKGTTFTIQLPLTY
jgi:PAS domain S-box-containing protein